MMRKFSTWLNYGFQGFIFQIIDATPLNSQNNPFSLLLCHPFPCCRGASYFRAAMSRSPAHFGCAATPDALVLGPPLNGRPQTSEKAVLRRRFSRVHGTRQRQAARAGRIPRRYPRQGLRLARQRRRWSLRAADP